MIDSAIKTLICIGLIVLGILIGADQKTSSSFSYDCVGSNL